MQLIPRKMLFDIMSHKHDVVFKQSHSIDEIDNKDSNAFSSFMKLASSTYNYINSSHKKSNDAMQDFYEVMFDFMEQNIDNIRYVSSGSSRTVYALADGTALKLAKSNAGRAQNKQEAKNCMDPIYKYEIFPDFYAADKKDWLALNCELCAKAEKSDFAKLFKLQPTGIASIIELIIKMKLSNFELEKAKKHFESLNVYTYAYFIQQLIDNKTLATKAILSLLDFYRRNGLDEMLLGDVESVANWGLVIRDNQPVLVILDAGFNENVYQTYYVSRQSS